MPTIFGTLASETLRGTAEADLIYGRAGNDTLWGYGGNDLLNGGPGIDVMYGGLGDDNYAVDNIEDQVIEVAGQGLDTIRTSTHYALADGVSVERLFAASSTSTTPLDLQGNDLANRISGNNGANALQGNAGDDVLLGLGGNDVLIGGPGRDRLNGGSGDDLFVFVDTSWDRIYDFETGSDSIDLGWLIGADQFEFIGAAGFSGSPGEGRFANGKFQLDIDGDAVADLNITITGLLTEGDFSFGAAGYWDY